ncbi:MAG: ABC transporter ATP-binding protein [Bdellovibrionota bacterium]
MMPIYIHLENVCFAYPGQAIFHDVSLTLANDKKTVLTARNGAGKSTLIALIAHMLRPDHGKINVMVGDQSISQAHFFQRIGLCLSHPYLLDDFNVQENLHIFASMYQHSKKQVDPTYLEQLINLFGLQPLLYKKCKMLSQGELKKVCLTRALMHQPDFVFLDEPSNALDTRAKDLLSEHLKTLDALVVIASHDRQWAAEIGHQVLTIENRGIHAL